MSCQRLFTEQLELTITKLGIENWMETGKIVKLKIDTCTRCATSDFSSLNSTCEADSWTEAISYVLFRFFQNSQYEDQLL
jgi:hypothetical protein